MKNKLKAAARWVHARQKRKIVFFVLLVVIFLSSAAFTTFKFLQWRQEAKVLQKRKTEWLALRAVLKKQVNAFRGVSGIIIKDLDMNWGLVHNQDALFPSASVVKIPIMAAVFQAASEGRIGLQDVLTLREAGKVNGSGILKGMEAGSEFSVEQLVGIMIAHSDNTASNMLIDLLGFDYFNTYFKKMGLENTNLSRKMMDFKYRRNGVENYTTAADIATLLEKIYRKEFINSDISEKCLRLLKQQKINDRIPAQLPVDVEVAHKTGLENNVCHDAGIVFTAKGDLLICVLTKNARNNRAAKRFISDIALYAYSYCQQL